jgi:hypothetical protein
MTTFSRYYDQNGLLHETTMEELEELIKDENNKGKIADLIYHRYYERYLKIFDFIDNEEKEYTDTTGVIRKGLKYNMEFKNGFAMMVNCCLLIETLASFLVGDNKTPKKQGVGAYIKVFEKAKIYNNELRIFCNEPIYGCVRCGLLHQGETYGGFKIRRDGISLFDKSTNTINATKFCYWVNQFLKSYQDELSGSEAKWNDVLWKNCKDKLIFIIKNSKQKS